MFGSVNYKMIPKFSTFWGYSVSPKYFKTFYVYGLITAIKFSTTHVKTRSFCIPFFTQLIIPVLTIYHSQKYSFKLTETSFSFIFTYSVNSMAYLIPAWVMISLSVHNQLGRRFSPKEVAVSICGRLVLSSALEDTPFPKHVCVSECNERE